MISKCLVAAIGFGNPVYGRKNCVRDAYSLKKDNTKRVASVKHEHTCPLIVKGRLDSKTIKKSLAEFSKQTREMMIRSETQKILESSAVSNKNAVENEKQVTAKERRLHGENFEAIKAFPERFVNEEPFLCYEFDDDINGLPVGIK